ncbi:MAG: class I SAM-dependent methyltransferase [Planctomycetota bacterium]|nr:class I SAM-dependent methyltransferase [Planctomycetota bacterium]MDA1213149.1 class I SAM-dependent methyltransferase [Planctomycetota bacterium]
MKRRYGHDNDRWRVVSGSLLDRTFLETAGQFDIVYCWGVAHHTGYMWTAIDNLVHRVKPGGILVLAIYNDQLYISRAWRRVKQIYRQLPGLVRPLYIFAIGCAVFAKRLAVTSIASLLRLLTFRNPFVPLLNWRAETQTRGMHGWYDLIDWVGGWPFEVARPEVVFRFVRDRGFTLQELTTSVGHGCNEFVFKNNDPEEK